MSFNPGLIMVGKLVKPVLQILFFSMMLSSIALSEDNKKWYQIEIMIFKQTNQDDEFFYRNLELTWSKPLIVLDQDERFIEAPKTLQDANRKLTKHWGYRVLWHNAWYQQALDKSNAPWILVKGGYTRFQHNELEGAFKIYLSRYFHLDTNLWLTEFLEEGTGIASSHIEDSQSITMQPKWPSLPPVPRIVDQRHCNIYKLLPVVQRKQLFSITVNLNKTQDSTFLTTQTTTWNERIEQRLNQFPNSISIPNSEGYPQCQLPLDVSHIEDPITGNLTALDEWQQKQARQELQDYLQRRLWVTQVAMHFPGNLQRFLDNPHDSGQSALIPVENIFLLKKSQRILTQRNHYIDHPKIGVIISINPVDEDTANSLNLE